MADIVQVWNEALPTVRAGVTGVGVWAALNSSVPVALEDGTFVLGLASKDGELSGHLRMVQTKKLIETEVSKRVGTPVQARIIDGTTQADWERAKRKDAEGRRLQEIADSKARAEIASRSNWEGIYEQLSRKFAAMPNKSMPQSRAKFFIESVEMVAEARKVQANRDDLNERNFARCLERIAQYTEIPSGLVAKAVLEKTGEL